MKQTINRYEFDNQFRAIRPDNFSYEGLKALFNFFEELEDDMGEELELDVIAICSEYSEYKSLDELVEAHNSGDTIDYTIIEDFEDRTIVIPVEYIKFEPNSKPATGYIIQDF